MGTMVKVFLHMGLHGKERMKGGLSWKCIMVYIGRLYQRL